MRSLYDFITRKFQCYINPTVIYEVISNYVSKSVFFFARSKIVSGGSKSVHDALSVNRNACIFQWLWRFFSSHDLQFNAKAPGLLNTDTAGHLTFHSILSRAVILLICIYLENQIFMKCMAGNYVCMAWNVVLWAGESLIVRARACAWARARLCVWGQSKRKPNTSTIISCVL